MQNYKNSKLKNLAKRVVSAADDMVDSTPEALRKALEDSSETEIKRGISSLYERAANVPGAKTAGAVVAAITLLGVGATTLPVRFGKRQNKLRLKKVWSFAKETLSNQIMANKYNLPLEEIPSISSNSKYDILDTINPNSRAYQNRSEQLKNFYEPLNDHFEKNFGLGFSQSAHDLREGKEQAERMIAAIGGDISQVLPADKITDIQVLLQNFKNLQSDRSFNLPGLYDLSEYSMPDRGCTGQDIANTAESVLESALEEERSFKDCFISSDDKLDSENITYEMLGALLKYELNKYSMYKKYLFLIRGSQT
jgi:hypothetical protein